MPNDSNQTTDEMTIVQFLRASGEHWDEDRYTAGADRIEALEQALRVIAEMPVPEQDNMIAANMRRIAIGAIK